MHTKPIENPAILAVYIFGSHVRGDADPSSDVDVLVITDNGKPDTYKLVRFIEAQFNKSSDLSIYSLARLKKMHEEGHLFSWHIYNESRYLLYPDTKDIIKELGKPSDYANAQQDIVELIDLLDTIALEVANQPNIVYEAGLLYVCLRNIALSASWYSSLGLKFGRNSPYQLSEDMPKFPLLAEDYYLLVLARHATTRGSTHPVIKNNFLMDCLNKSQKWAENIQEWIRKNEYV